jgi:hypothetical protein
MKQHDFVPRPTFKFLTWVNGLLENLAPLLERVGFPVETYQALVTLRDDFAVKLQLTETPATRTQVAVQSKQDARKILEKAVRKAVRQYLAPNPAVSDSDRERLGLPIYKTTRTPAPVATTYPHFYIDSHTIRRLIVHFYDQWSKKMKGKPEGQHGAEIRWVISGEPVVKVKDLIHSSFDTRSPFTIEFEGHERGQTVYFCLCWENTRGEKGPWSEIQSAVIP